MDDRRKTILVVDDAPENILVITTALGARYRVKAATGGAKALQICAADPPPDLVLLDVVMPGMNGYEVCRSLKADARTARIPVIFLTGLEDEGEEARGLSLGAVDFLRKPIDPGIVNERVAAHLM